MVHTSLRISMSCERRRGVWVSCDGSGRRGGGCVSCDGGRRRGRECVSCDGSGRREGGCDGSERRGGGCVSCDGSGRRGGWLRAKQVFSNSLELAEAEAQECEKLANKLLHFLNSCSHHKEKTSYAINSHTKLYTVSVISTSKLRNTERRPADTVNFRYVHLHSCSAAVQRLCTVQCCSNHRYKSAYEWAARV